MHGSGECDPIVNMVRRYAMTYADDDYEGSWNRLYGEYLARYPHYRSMIAANRGSGLRMNTIDSIEQCQNDRVYRSRIPNDVPGARPMSDLLRVCRHLYRPDGLETRMARKGQREMTIAAR
jgi:hypothetical protein